MSQENPSSCNNHLLKTSINELNQICCNVLKHEIPKLVVTFSLAITNLHERWLLNSTNGIICRYKKHPVVVTPISPMCTDGC